MKTVLTYNFEEKDIEDADFEALYTKRRRDSSFAFVYEKDGDTYALRDHLGIVPLFYCRTAEGLRFSTDLGSLPHTGALSREGLRTYLALASTKLVPLVEGIKIVPPGTVLRIAHDGSESIVYRYSVSPRQISIFKSFGSLVAELDEMFMAAMARQARESSAGVYLSGGIDSGLIAIYLQRLGIPFTAFSSLTRGSEDAEKPYIDINVKVSRPKETHEVVLAGAYEDLARRSIPLYKQPTGNLTSLAICNLWENAPLASQERIFLGQNSDVINNAMDNHYVGVFGGLLPQSLTRDRLAAMLGRYLSKHTGGMLDTDPIDLASTYGSSRLTSFQLVALAGMFLSRTPTDGEIMAQPAINLGIPIGNPYYDMDIVEFLMGLRLIHKLRFGKDLHVPVSLDKRVLQALALQNGLPKELVYRKKGFTVPRQGTLRPFFDSLPTSSFGISCRTDAERFAAHSLNLYGAWRNTKFTLST